MSTFFQQGLQQGINLYNQAAQRARQAELDAIDKTRIEVLNKATEMQIKQAESAMELGELKTAQFKRKMDKDEEERAYARAVDEWADGLEIDYASEDALTKLREEQSKLTGVPVTNAYLAATIQRIRADITSERERIDQIKAADAVSDIFDSIMPRLKGNENISIEDLSNMVFDVQNAMVGDLVFRDKEATARLADLSRSLSSAIGVRVSREEEMTDRMNTITTQIPKIADDLMNSLEEGADQSVIRSLATIMNQLQGELGVLRGKMGFDPNVETRTGIQQRDIETETQGVQVPGVPQSGETVLLSTEPDENRGRTRRPRRRKPAEEEEVPRNMGAFRRGASKSNVKPSDQVSNLLGLTPYSNRQMITRKRNN